jgi:hypothetical protein
MQQSSSWGANRPEMSMSAPHFTNLNVHYRIHKSPTPVSILHPTISFFWTCSPE